VPREIERKFIVASDGWRAAAGAGRHLRQAYLAETDRAAIRVRIEDGARALLTIKSAKPGLTRSEFEYELPLADALELGELRQGSVLEKDRFLVRFGERDWEVDVYAGDNEGLTIAEIELAAEDEELELPPWAGREVTGEPPYYAARLAQYPFRAWTASERYGSL
jgi:adenylate cyclase